MSEARRVLELAAEIRRYMKIEKQAREVVRRWEAGYIGAVKPGYTSSCDLDMALLRDALDPDGSEEDENGES